MAKKKPDRRGKKKPAKPSRPRNYTPLGKHKKVGNTLHTSWTEYGNMSLQSWANDRLPEMLWAALLITGMERDASLEIFRSVARLSAHFRDQDPTDVTLTAVSKWPAARLEEFLGIVSATPESRAALRPLLIFPELPGHDQWKGKLDPPDLDADARPLMEAVSRTLWHQTQEATDCRWVRVAFFLGAGRLKIHKAMAERVYQINGYPNVGDQRSVRPHIRSFEVMINALEKSDGPPAWSAAFWLRCHHETACIPPPEPPEVAPSSPATTFERVQDTYISLAEHAVNNEPTSAIDARHNAVFGTGLLAVGMVVDLMQAKNSRTAIGRSGLRTLVEQYITLAYLLMKDDPKLWLSFRSYGMEQAKLAFLKLDEVGDETFASVEKLREIANEDAWQEFLPIRLEHWGKADLRKMSLEAGVKDDYDRYYGWTSVYAHGNWGAIRDSVFQPCVNPLHRLHRIPRVPRTLEDVLPAACTVTDKILDLVATAYPGLKHRLRDVSVDVTEAKDPPPGLEDVKQVHEP